MASIFRRLIKREFGMSRYKMYYSCVSANITELTKITGTILEDMRNELNKMETGNVAAMHDRLNNALITSVRISRGYIMTVLVYLVAAFFLLFDGLATQVTIIAMVLLSLCFAYKTYEYLVNRFCYIDVQIVLVYKKALEQRLVGSVNGKGEG